MNYFPYSYIISEVMNIVSNASAPASAPAIVGDWHVCGAMAPAAPVHSTISELYY